MTRSGALDLVRALDAAPMYEQRGRLVSVIGTTLRVAGVSPAIGQNCEIIDGKTGFRVWAEVIGLAGDDAILTPLGDIHGLSQASEVVLRTGLDGVPFGAHLLGRVLDARMQPLDGLGPVQRGEERPLHGAAPNPMLRTPMSTVMETGVRAIDGLLTIGVGQRVGPCFARGDGRHPYPSVASRWRDFAAGLGGCPPVSRCTTSTAPDCSRHRLA